VTRGRKPLVEPSIPTHLHLPASWRTKLDLILYSPVEGRIPKGAYQRFFLNRLVEFFDTREMDLGPYLGSLPREHLLRARPATIEALTRLLQQAPSQGPKL
jgi:hypothetical protein